LNVIPLSLLKSSVLSCKEEILLIEEDNAKSDKLKNGTNLTTEESYAGSYYWACYTIKFVNDTYKNSDINVNINVDNITKTTTANLTSPIITTCITFFSS